MAFTFSFLKFFAVGLLLLAPLLVFFTVLIGALGIIIGRKEAWSRGESLYYAMITATTVGYGDFRPRSPLGRMLSICIAFSGLIMTGIIVSLAVWATTQAFALHYDAEKLRTLFAALPAFI